jgi:outer membrane protein assembly factor BamB
MFRNSRAASTPVVDADGVYVLFAGGQLAGLTHEGQVRWQRCLVGDYGEFKNGRGLSSSLAQTERAVIALVDHEGPSYAVAVDKQTGQNVWKVPIEARGAPRGPRRWSPIRSEAPSWFSVPAGTSKRWTVKPDVGCGACAASQATTSLPQDSHRTGCLWAPAKPSISR